MTTPKRTPEGELISLALRRERIKSPELAQAIKVSTATMQNWVKGYRVIRAGEYATSRPDGIELALIADYLRVSVGELQEIGRNDAAQELQRIRRETVGRPMQGGDKIETDELRFRRPEGMSDEQWQEVRARGLGYLDAIANEVARER